MLKRLQGCTYTAEEVANEDDQLTLRWIFVGEKRVKRHLVAILVLDGQLASFLYGLLVGQRLAGLLTFVGAVGRHCSDSLAVCCVMYVCLCGREWIVVGVCVYM